MSIAPQNASAPAISHVEEIKLENPGLGGVLLTDIPDLSSERISEASEVLIKFHGSYQQDDRDQRRERKKAQLDRAWQFMVRTKHPAGA